MNNREPTPEEAWLANNTRNKDSLKGVKSWYLLPTKYRVITTPSNKFIAEDYPRKMGVFKIHPRASFITKRKAGLLHIPSKHLLNRVRQPQSVSRKARKTPAISVPIAPTYNQVIRTQNVYRYIHTVDPAVGTVTVRNIWSNEYNLSNEFADLLNSLPSHVNCWKFTELLVWKGEMVMMLEQLHRRLSREVSPWEIMWWSFDLSFKGARKPSLVITFKLRDFNPLVVDSLRQDPQLLFKGE